MGWTRAAEAFPSVSSSNQTAAGATTTPTTTTVTCDFTQSKAGYGIRASKSLMPAIESWKFPENAEPVPAFDFQVRNELVSHSRRGGRKI